MANQDILSIMEEIDNQRFNFIIGLSILANNHELKNENGLLLINREISKHTILSFQKRLTEEIIDPFVDYLAIDVINILKTFNSNKKAMWEMYIEVYNNNAEYLQEIASYVTQHTGTDYRIK